MFSASPYRFGWHTKRRPRTSSGTLDMIHNPWQMMPLRMPGSAKAVVEDVDQRPATAHRRLRRPRGDERVVDDDRLGVADVADELPLRPDGVAKDELQWVERRPEVDVPVAEALQRTVNRVRSL